MGEEGGEPDGRVPACAWCLEGDCLQGSVPTSFNLKNLSVGNAQSASDPAPANSFPVQMRLPTAPCDTFPPCQSMNVKCPEICTGCRGFR